MSGSKNTLKVTLERANGLHDGDLFGSMDVFARITCGGETKQSSTKKKAGRNPVFNETFMFNNVPDYVTQITVELFDVDLLSNELLGTAAIPIATARKVGTDRVQANVIRPKKNKQEGVVYLVLECGASTAPKAAPAAQPAVYPQPLATNPAKAAGAYPSVQPIGAPAVGVPAGPYPPAPAAAGAAAAAGSSYQSHPYPQPSSHQQHPPQQPPAQQAPPQQSPYPSHGAPPPQGYGAPPPQGYGAPPPQGYGAPPPQGYYPPPGGYPPQYAPPTQPYPYAAPYGQPGPYPYAQPMYAQPQTRTVVVERGGGGFGGGGFGGGGMGAGLLGLGGGLLGGMLVGEMLDDVFD